MSDKIISKQTAFTSKLFTVEETELASKNGRVRKHFDIVRRPTVSIFPVTKDFDIYLISQYRSLYNKTVLEGIAGYIDNGEEPLIAAKRELQEETGITAKDWVYWGAVQLSASVIKTDSHIFIARDLAFGKDNPDPGEQISLIKMALNEAVEKVLSREITMSVSIIGILLLDKLQREGKL